MEAVSESRQAELCNIGSHFTYLFRGSKSCLCCAAITTHASNDINFQERAYVTGLRAANFVIDELGDGSRADILPVSCDTTKFDIYFVTWHIAGTCE